MEASGLDATRSVRNCIAGSLHVRLEIAAGKKPPLYSAMITAVRADGGALRQRLSKFLARERAELTNSVRDVVTLRNSAAERIVIGTEFFFQRFHCRSDAEAFHGFRKRISKT
jgi:hypothetical protein